MDKDAIVSSLRLGLLTLEDFSDLAFVRHEKSARAVTIEYLLAGSSEKQICVLPVSEFELYWNALRCLVTTYMNPPCIALGGTSYFQYLHVREAQLVAWNSSHVVKLIFEGGGEVCVMRQSKSDAEKLFHALKQVINLGAPPSLSMRH